MVEELTPLVVQGLEGNRFLLKEPFRLLTSFHQHQVITIKPGLVTDFASVPRIFWNLFPPHTYEVRGPALVHDALYQFNVVPRKTADKLFYKHLRSRGTSKLKAWAMYQAVRLGGKKAYETYTRRLRAGLPPLPYYKDKTPLVKLELLQFMSLDDLVSGGRMEGSKEQFLQFLVQTEGAYAEDVGGRTVIGIAERHHPEVVAKIETLAQEAGKKLADFAVDIWYYLQGRYKREVSAQLREAAKIIRKFYFDLFQELPLPEQVLFVYWDAIVNQGLKTANRLLQRSLQQLGEPIIADGIVGPKTLAAINSSGNHPHLFEIYLLQRAYQYAQTRLQELYLRGWIKRLIDLQRYIINTLEV